MNAREAEFVQSRLAEKRATNRRQVVQMRMEPPHHRAGSLREDGLTGTEVLEIWKRTGATAYDTKVHGKRGARG